MEKQRRYRAIGLSEELRRQGRYQRWLARRVGVHEVTLSLAANGHRTIPEELANRIAEVLDVPFFVLFELTDVSKNLTDRITAA
jgi:plasmid maintenance system antidote protein VapI